MDKNTLDDETVWTLLGGILVAALALAHKDRWLPQTGRWLQDNHVLAPPGAGVVDMGRLGSLDAPRLALIVVTTVVVGVLTAAERRRRRAQLIKDALD
ncbi:hypothetical protein GCM10027418_17640 [Mariniluteicoccus endophyticus]